MAKNRLQELHSMGQSIWLDSIDRRMLTDGELERRIRDDALTGMTSNPTIFQKALASSDAYDEQLLAAEQGLTPMQLFELVETTDVRDACDLFAGVYSLTRGADGFVSIEVSPGVSRSADATVEEARRLWKTVDRPNVMVKVPGTPEGAIAVRRLIAEGINVNITLLFAIEAHERVIEAYLAGLEDRVKARKPIEGLASVASFFVSRVDTEIDKRLDALIAKAPQLERERLQLLKGRAAIANAKLAYRLFTQKFSGPRWEALSKQGARVQRPLWASTSTKNPEYRDVMYVEELIGPHTVDTVPPATLEAFRDHGKPRLSLTEDVPGARRTMADLAAVGISMKEVTDKLTKDGVKLFADAFNELLQAVEKNAQPKAPGAINPQNANLPSELDSAVKKNVEDWRAGGKVRRLWAHDASLWTGEDEASWLGWLDIVEQQLAQIGRLKELAADVKSGGFSDILLLRMGGSSLCPAVLALTFGQQQGFSRLHVLDSTDPAQIRHTEEKIDLANTLFIVSSKSGSTLEPNIYKQYFFERVKAKVGEKEAGNRFIAITDPGSKMQQVAEADKFRRIFMGVPSIGGRYSALSNFGMVPAAIMGLDIAKFLNNTEEMVKACRASAPADSNPGVILGTILGVAANHGRDKLTIVTSPGIFDLGAWLEQLIAESTGKIGKGIIPVDRERLAKPAAYGNDRVFAYLRLASKPNKAQDAAVAALERAGHSVVRITLPNIYNLGQEFFRWEIATAVAGSIIGINAFNQPDVEASKIETKKLTSQYETTGSLPPESPFFEEKGIKLFADEKNAAALKGGTKLVDVLNTHLSRLGSGDYFAVLGYITMNPANEKTLQTIRHTVRDKKKVATVLGFGPRFLHSTGQAYKGGPNSGVFLQITCDDAKDLPVPGQKYTFGVVKAAQARGDFAVLAERGRRALRVHLGKNLKSGLATLTKAVQKAIA